MKITIKNNQTYNIPLTQIYSKLHVRNKETKTDGSKQKKNKQQMEMSLNLNYDSSISLNSTSNFASSIINVYGPSEAKLRFKSKAEEAFVEVISTFNYELSKEKQFEFNLFFKNFCESVIKTNEYPRCIVTVAINIISYDDEVELKKHIINSTMVALSLSGIDLKCFALGTIIKLDRRNNNSMEIEKENNSSDIYLVIADICNTNNILNIESNNPIEIDELENMIKVIDEQITEESDLCKRKMLKLRSNN